MLRRPLAGLLAAGLVLTAGLAGTAQDKKDAKKEKPARVAINDPEKAKADPDFALQGEYAGEASGQKLGVQVIAKGGGEFDLKILPGGLPGAGSDGKTSTKATAKRGDGGTAAVTGDKVTGTLAAGKLTLKLGGGPEATLTRVERQSPTLGAKPPSGAVVLFGQAGDEAKWNGGKLVELSDGKFLGVGEKSKDAFGAFKAHVEFRLPWMPNSRGQGRGNSGFYFQDRYECQVLDSFGLTGENNECGGIYTLHKPAVNMCLPPLVWQTYDVDFTPATFDAAGKKTANARVTVLHNGVKIHDNVELAKETGGGQKEGPTPGPIQFQNHGDPVVFRNVWVVEAK